MKISDITIEIEPTEDGDPRTATVAHYSASTGQWTINGVLYPKHLKILTVVSEMCREADKSRGRGTRLSEAYEGESVFGTVATGGPRA